MPGAGNSAAASDFGSRYPMGNFFKYTTAGMLVHLYALATRREPVVEGCCVMCGRCCREISLSDGPRWVRTRKEFDRLVAKDPAYTRFVPIGRGPGGYMLFRCCFISPEGFCLGHSIRPSVCSEYPAPDLTLCGGRLLDGCGYRIVWRKKGEPRPPADVIDDGDE